MNHPKVGNKVFIKSMNKFGTINYMRMAPPTYDKPQAFSVRTDTSDGTIVSADDIEVVE